MAADAPPFVQEIFEQTIALRLGERIRARHDPTRPFQIPKGEGHFCAGLACISEHRSKRAIGNVPYCFDSKPVLGMKTQPKVLKMFE
jgi:hypothetical protein